MRLLKQFTLKVLILIGCMSAQAQVEKKFTRADTLRGAYGPYRANNDLLYYELDIKVDPDKKIISGKNTITFKMLKTDNKIQLDLYANMVIEKIVYENNPLKYTREFNAVFIEFPQLLLENTDHSIIFYYSGNPIETGRFGGVTFKKDSLGNHWVNTACQGIGASVWWPNKDQQPDEADSMLLKVAIPSELTDVSNGRFIGKIDLGDGYTAYTWKIHYPINNYSVSLNIGKYAHFSDHNNNQTFDYYVLPYHLEKAKRQFAQVKPMFSCYEHYFGEYPFIRDGYKLIEVPYAGMEHQSAVTYGNYFTNGYLGIDWTGVGINTKFDYIIIHESGHEWFGNSITCKDVSDAWIQEGWCTYAEVVYVECMFGHGEALKYINAYKLKVANEEPIIGPLGVNNWPNQDMYFKGALFLNTLRNVINNDEKWWRLIYDYATFFKYKNIMTSDILAFFNKQTGDDFTAIFDQYLNQKDIPTLEFKFEQHAVDYRWNAPVKNFNMPLKVRINGRTNILKPNSAWQRIKCTKKNFKIETDLFYINVKELSD